MGDRFWSTGCRSDVEWYGYPGWGAYYRSRFGTFGVSGGVYQTFAARGYECGMLGPPVKDYGWIAEMNYGRGCWGQWFEGGAIGYHDGRWNVMYGRYGQSAFRRVGFALRHPIQRLTQSSVEAPLRRAAGGRVTFEPQTARAADQPCQLYSRHSPKVVRTQGHHRRPVYLQNQVYGRIQDPELLWLCGSCHDAVHEWLSWLLAEARRPSPEPGRLAKAEALAAFAWFTTAMEEKPG